MKLKSITINGAKNIDNELTVNFIDKKVCTIKDFTDFKIKAIYGPNGSGKTAIYEALHIYRGLSIFQDYIIHEAKKLKSFININTKKLDIKVVYCVLEAEKIVEYSHKIQVMLEKEKLVFSEDTLLKNNKEIYTYKKGENDGRYLLHPKTRSTSIIHAVYEKNLILHYNLEDKSSILSTLISNKLTNEELKVLYEQIVFSVRLNFYGESKSSLDQEEFVIWDPHSNYDIMSKTKVEISELEDHLKGIKKIEKFIKIFKPQIKAIESEYTKIENEEKEFYIFNNKIVYKNYKCSYELESVGIKKLCSLTNTIDAILGGQIVLIDEFDANLHDYAISQIISFLCENATGQLIFTTHNIQNMSELTEVKNSIDFLSLNNTIKTWKKVGNYSPISAYSKGMINPSDFSYDEFDLMEVFDCD